MVEDLVAAVEELVELDPARLADGETVVALHRTLAQVEAVTARATAVWGRRARVGGGRCEVGGGVVGVAHPVAAGDGEAAPAARAGHA